MWDRNRLWAIQETQKIIVVGTDWQVLMRATGSGLSNRKLGGKGKAYAANVWESDIPQSGLIIATTGFHSRRYKRKHVSDEIEVAN